MFGTGVREVASAREAEAGAAGGGRELGRRSRPFDSSVPGSNVSPDATFANDSGSAEGRSLLLVAAGADGGCACAGGDAGFTDGGGGAGGGAGGCASGAAPGAAG